MAIKVVPAWSVGGTGACGWISGVAKLVS